MKIYESIEAHRVVCDLPTAESIKYASNAFLAVKLSFVNEIASISELTGANLDQVLYGMSLDDRIGNKFLSPGPGWGGSCFPKDTREIVFTGKNLGTRLLTVEAAILSNQSRIQSIANSVIRDLGGNVSGHKLAVWGLSFKANTDDTRESPAVEISRILANHGAEVIAYDPMADLEGEGWLDFADSALSACEGASALLVLTEWEEFAQVDPILVKERMKESPVVLDTRGVLPSQEWRTIFSKFRAIGEL
jgi:UDPglucose 6-dehydrogenase